MLSSSCLLFYAYWRYSLYMQIKQLLDNDTLYGVWHIHIIYKSDTHFSSSFCSMFFKVSSLLLGFPLHSNSNSLTVLPPFSKYNNTIRRIICYNKQQIHYHYPMCILGSLTKNHLHQITSWFSYTLYW